MKSLFVVCVLLLSVLSGNVLAQGTPPPFPQAFYGDATICGKPAPIGTVVDALEVARRVVLSIVLAPAKPPAESTPEV